MPERTTLLKPVYSAVKVYWPGASCGIAYSPLSLTVTLRLSLVPVLVIVMLAPGTTAPLSSVTRPTIVARTPCAARTDTNSKSAVAPFRKNRISPPDDYFFIEARNCPANMGGGGRTIRRIDLNSGVCHDF